MNWDVASIRQSFSRGVERYEEFCSSWSKTEATSKSSSTSKKVGSPWVVRTESWTCLTQLLGHQWETKSVFFQIQDWQQDLQNCSLFLTTLPFTVSFVLHHCLLLSTITSALYSSTPQRTSGIWTSPSLFPSWRDLREAFYSLMPTILRLLSPFSWTLIS